MTETHSDTEIRASTLEEVQSAVMSAAAKGEPLDIVGGGSKRFYGRASKAESSLNVSAISGVVEYEPRELICVVRPGTPLSALETVLAKEGQMLAFEPPSWGKGATVGGTLACNMAGPRRFKAGAARDHLLGFQAVNGKGDAFRGGGRVVKNVTGYDLSKLMCGSFGTLGVLTEACIKVLPMAETQRTVVFDGLPDREGLELLIEASKSSHDVSGLAHLPDKTKLPAPLNGMENHSVTLIRLEGPEPSVAYRSEKISELSRRAGAYIDGADSAELWKAIGEVESVISPIEETLWRFSVPPTESLGIVEALRARIGLRVMYDWGGGLIWAAIEKTEHSDFIHNTAEKAGGQATLMKSPVPLDENFPVFPRLDKARWRLHSNLKQSFDPKGILNRGRLYSGL